MSQLEKVTKEQDLLRAEWGNEFSSRFNQLETTIEAMLAEQKEVFVSELSGGNMAGKSKSRR